LSVTFAALTELFEGAIRAMEGSRFDDAARQLKEAEAACAHIDTSTTAVELEDVARARAAHARCAALAGAIEAGLRAQLEELGTQQRARKLYQHHEPR
jgi:hypothetical protein